MLTGEKSHNSESAGSRLDRLCNAFELAWKRNERPRLEEFLQQCPADERADAFPHLLGLELDYREHQSESFQADEYYQRFPEYTVRIDELFKQFGSNNSQFGSGRPSGGSGSAPGSGVSSLGLQQIGRYKLLSHCGRGGMGDVYKARHPLLRKPRAVKVLRDHYDHESADRFRMEIETAEVLVHQNIVLVHDAGEDNGRLFLVMEYVDGVDLHRLTRDLQPLPVPAVCEMIRQAAEGLQHAHEHFLVHRDIKPSNLMMNKLGHVKILDFGLARFNAERDDTQSRLTTRDGALLGTVDFMAPEQWRNAAGVTIQADLYSLGCSLFFMLTGSVPYPKQSGLESVLDTLIYKQRAHQTFPIPDLHQFRDDVPPGLQDLLKRLMAKTPDERPITPMDVADELKQWADKASLHPLWPQGDAVKADNDDRTIEVRDPIGRGERIDSEHDTDSKGVTRVIPGSKGSQLPPVREPEPPTEPGGIVAPPATSRARRVVWMLIPLLLLAVVAFGVSQYVNRDPGLPEPARTNLPEDLRTLPGLNGGWWFDETPWLTPAVRQVLANEIEDGASKIRSESLLGLHDQLRQMEIVPVHARLNELTTAVRPLLAQRTDALQVRSLQNIDADRVQLTEQALAQQFTSLLPPELRVPAQATASEIAALNWPAPRLHLLACVLHQLSRGNRDFVPLAEQAYQQADVAYASSSQVSSGLKALFHADHARFHVEISGSEGQTQAVAGVQQAIEENQSSIRTAALRAFQADMLRRFYSASLERLQEAEVLLKAAADAADQADLHAKHPLRAEILERHAWVALEGWRLKAADRLFDEATAIRRATSGPENRFADENILLNDQGRAMALHFLGRDNSSNTYNAGAIFKYQQTINQILEKLDSDASRGDKRTARDRLPNLYERLADCYLYGAESNYQTAAEHLASAIARAEELQFGKSTSRWGHLNRLYYKQALAELLQPNPDSQAVQRLFEEAKMLQRGNAENPRESLYINEKLVAQALQNNDAAAFGKLFDLVYATDARTVSRKNVEVLLLAMRQLLSSGIDHLSGVQLNHIGKQLLQMTDEMRRGDAEILSVYLQPTWQLATKQLQQHQVDARTVSELQSVLDALTENASPE